MYNPGVLAPLTSRGEQSVYGEIWIFYTISSIQFCIASFQKLAAYFGTMLFQNNNKICEMRSEGYQCSETVFNFFSTRSNFIPKTKEIQMYALRELAKHLHEGKNSLERCYLYMIEVDAMANLWESSVMLNQKGQLLGRGCNCSNFFFIIEEYSTYFIGLLWTFTWIDI